MSDRSDPTPPHRRTDPVGDPRIGQRRGDRFFRLDGEGEITFTSKGAIVALGLLGTIAACWPKVEQASRIVAMPQQLDSTRADLKGWTDTARRNSTRLGTVEHDVGEIRGQVNSLVPRVSSVEQHTAAAQAQFDQAKTMRDAQLSEYEARLRAVEARVHH